MSDDIKKISIKNETHTHSHSGTSTFWVVLGIILIFLFLISIYIDIQESGLRCIKLKDCKSFEVDILTKIFVVDYNIDSEISYLKNNNNITNSPISPVRAVRSDLLVNVFFYIILIIIVFYLSYLIGGRGFVGVLSGLIGVGIYFILSTIITFILIKEIYIPLTCFIDLFNYMGVII